MSIAASAKVHPSSVLSPDVELGPDVEIGPYCLIQGKVKIGKGSFIEGHVTVGSRYGIVEIGENNHLCPGAVIGGPPQDVSYKGEPTKLIIGNNNVFREFSTVNLASAKGDCKTVIGNNCYLMAYVHVGHDSRLGNNVIMANDTNLGGHCEIGDHVVISAMCGLNQFTKVGNYAFIAGSSIVNKDIIPFSRAHGNYALIRATNKVGLSRAGYSREEVANIHKAIRILVMGSLTVEEGISVILSECQPGVLVDELIQFIRTSKRGIALNRGSNSAE
ncbi:MAG: acyl-ACP--UDP-N-acetylglucosamine O-acyltransferase [Pseudobdellovibrionaceae bacterium]